MKMITAYIQSFMLEKVTDALRQKQVHGVTVLDCSGFGRLTADQTPHYLDRGDVIGFSGKKKIEIVCRDKEVTGIMETIQKNAHTGRHGDGKIFVTDILESFDIRTDRQGEEIL